MTFEDIRDDFMHYEAFIKVTSKEEAEAALEFLKAETGKRNNAWKPELWEEYPHMCYAIGHCVISGLNTPPKNKTVVLFSELMEEDIEVRSEDILELI